MRTRSKTVHGIGPVISSAMIAADRAGDTFSKRRRLRRLAGLFALQQFSTGDRRSSLAYQSAAIALCCRNGRSRRINARRFIRRRAALDECCVDYLPHYQPVRFMKGKLRLRQVTRLCDDVIRRR